MSFTSDPARVVADTPASAGTAKLADEQVRWPESIVIGLEGRFVPRRV